MKDFLIYNIHCTKNPHFPQTPKKAVPTAGKDDKQMDYDGHIEMLIQMLIPACRSDMWIRGFDGAGPFYENIAAFALATNQFGNQEILTLTIDGSGRLYETSGTMMIFSAENPNLSDKTENETEDKTMKQIEKETLMKYFDKGFSEFRFTIACLYHGEYLCDIAAFESPDVADVCLKALQEHYSEIYPEASFVLDNRKQTRDLAELLKAVSADG